MKPLGKKHTQKSRQWLAEHEGIEMTPDELTEERKAAYATIRQELAKRGLPVPATDEEMFQMLKKYYKPKRK